MSIKIYTGKNKPTDIKFIFDVDSYCKGMRVKDNALNRKIISIIEQGSYISEDVFEDRFGRGLYVSCLSTSSKILILLNQKPDVLVNCSEIGLNALDLILECLDCMVYLDCSCLRFNSEIKCDVYVNDVLCSNIDEVNNALGKVDANEITGYRN